MTIHEKRFRVLNDVAPRHGGAYVLYLLQQANRAHHNPALEFAIEEANRLGVPVVACFGLLDGANGFPEANARHYAFLLQGLADAKAGLDARGIGFVMRKASPAEIAIDLARDASLLVLDRGYLAIQKRWYARDREAVDARIVQVEGDVVVPVETASPKHEFAARTLRPKLQRLWDDYLEPLSARKSKHRPDSLKLPARSTSSDPQKVLAGMTLDTEVGAGEALHRGRVAGAKTAEGVPRRRALGLWQRPQPARGGRGLAHESLPAFRPDLAGRDRAGRA